MRTRVVSGAGAIVLVLLAVAPAFGQALTPPEETAVTWIDQNREVITRWNRAIWDYAELPLMETRSAALLADVLERAGFRVERGVAGLPTAFVATFGSGSPVIALLGEYDALPGVRPTPEPTPPPVVARARGHIDGHNLIGVGAVAAALALKEAVTRHGLRGTIKVFGCPAEELYLGKVYMARAGLFEGLDAVLDWHPTFVLGSGWGTHMALNFVRYVFHGREAHGGVNPWTGLNALHAVQVMNGAVDAMRQHIFLQDKSTIGYTIVHGGGIPSVVPPVAEVWYFIHAPTREKVADLTRRIDDAARGAATATGTRAEIHFMAGSYPKLGNEALGRLLDKHMRRFTPVRFTPEELEFARRIQATLPARPPRLFMDVVPVEGTFVGGWATDSGDVSWLAPYVALSGGTEVIGTPSHTWQRGTFAGTVIGEKAMMGLAKAMATAAVELVQRPEEVERARAEFREKSRGFRYTAHVPPGPPPDPRELWAHWLAP